MEGVVHRPHPLSPSPADREGGGDHQECDERREERGAEGETRKVGRPSRSAPPFCALLHQSYGLPAALAKLSWLATGANSPAESKALPMKKQACW